MRKHFPAAACHHVCHMLCQFNLFDAEVLDSSPWRSYIFFGEYLILHQLFGHHPAPDNLTSRRKHSRRNRADIFFRNFSFHYSFVFLAYL